MNQDKQYPGRIDIARRTSSLGKDAINLRLTDECSGCLVIEVQMSLEEFAYAITGGGNCDCTFCLPGIEQVGKRAEYKTVNVLVPDGKPATLDERVRKAIAKHETDGWIGRDDDAKNWHCRVGESDGGVLMKVGYDRYIDAEAEPADAGSEDEGGE